MKRILAAGLLILTVTAARAQQWAVQTNLMDYLNFGTLNIEGAVAFHQHWSATAVAKLNPFHFKKGGEPLNARQQVFGAGVRYWPWHVYSGWWVGTRIQYQQYNRGGIKNPDTNEGDRWGMGLSGGFSYMINPHLNIDVGAGVWGGWDRFTTYSCPVCGLVKDKGSRAFILPNDLLVALVYVF